MAHNISLGEYKIVSLIEGNPPTSWTVTPEGDNTYRLMLSGKYFYTGVVDDKVLASIDSGKDLEWRATYREQQDAYTIEPADDQDNGWTVTDDFEVHSLIVIKKIEALDTMHPRFLSSQLFKFVPVHAD
ncbi:hypothetical protein OG21DRAFT_1317559 [Imleria badia]|nr:hypothetical protein OG21DRAFT_1317559 [Imleria badia]